MVIPINERTTLADDKVSKVTFRKVLTMPRYSLPMLGLIGFYLFWNIPANTWGSFLNCLLISIDGRSQQLVTLSAFFANILGGLVLYGSNMKLSDTKYRYVMMRIGLIFSLVPSLFRQFQEDIG